MSNMILDDLAVMILAAALIFIEFIFEKKWRKRTSI